MHTTRKCLAQQAAIVTAFSAAQETAGAIGLQGRMVS